MESIRQKISSFKTKHKEGFLLVEIEFLLNDFPGVSIDQFKNELIGDTCMVNDEQGVHSHFDVEKSLRCLVQKRELQQWEWD